MKVAISGAGVAGAALAHWLQRTGHTPTVIERAPKFRTGGYMIDFWGVGYQVAKRMGITDQIAAAGYHMEHVRSVGPTGKVKADLGVDVFRRMVGDDFTSLPRGDLAAAIYTTIKDQVETIFDDSIATIDEHRDGVRLTFERTAPRDFDLVIGADGLHSNVRRLVFGPERDFEHYLGCKVAACVVDGYRPRDERSYVLYNTVDRQLARSRCAATAPCSCSSSAPNTTTPAWHPKMSCATNSATWAGKAGTFWPPSTTSRTCTSTWSAKSGWTAGHAVGCC